MPILGERRAVAARFGLLSKFHCAGMLSCWWTRFLVSFTWLIIGFQAEALAAQPRIFEPYDGLPDTTLDTTFPYLPAIRNLPVWMTWSGKKGDAAQRHLDAYLGFRSSAIWFRLKIDTRNLEADDYRFIIDYAFLDLVTMYQVVDGVVVEEVSVGNSFDLASVRILTRHLSSL